MGRLLSIVVVLVVTLPMGSKTPSLHAQSDERIPVAVQAARDNLKEALESGASVRDVVTEYVAAPWIASVIRNSPRSARTWQLSPEVVPDLPDEEIVNFVVARAQHIILCTSLLWSLVSLADMQQMTEVSETALTVMRRLATPPEIEGRQARYRVAAPSCIELVDRNGDTAVIRSSADITDVLSYERTFAESESMAFRSDDLVGGPFYAENVAYFESRFAGSMTVDHGVANVLRNAMPGWSDDGQVFRFTTSGLMMYFATALHEDPQLVFLAPFSW